MARSLLVLSVFLISSLAVARSLVRVGAYEFPPYFDVTPAETRGLTVETVKILNSLQNEFTFEIQRLPAKLRYIHFEKKRIDLFLFEDPAWEWSKYKYEFVPLDVEDGEVYVTKKATRTPSNFEDLKDMRIAIVRGFHYGFAGLDADERTLKRNFKVEIADDSDGSIHLVRIGVVDVTVVAKSYIYDYLRKHPGVRDQISISNNYDSTYKLGVVFNPEGRISREKLEALIAKLKKNSQFIKLVEDRFRVAMNGPGKTIPGR